MVRVLFVCQDEDDEVGDGQHLAGSQHQLGAARVAQQLCAAKRAALKLLAR